MKTKVETTEESLESNSWMAEDRRPQTLRKKINGFLENQVKNIWTCVMAIIIATGLTLHLNWTQLLISLGLWTLYVCALAATGSFDSCFTSPGSGITLECGCQCFVNAMGAMASGVAGGYVDLSRYPRMAAWLGGYIADHTQDIGARFWNGTQGV